MGQHFDHLHHLTTKGRGAMIAKIGVYKKQNDEKPTKEFVVYRVFMNVSQKIGDWLELGEAAANAIKAGDNALLKEIDKEATEKIIEIFHALFDDFEDDDLNYIDQSELRDFMARLAMNLQGGFDKVRKN